MSGLAAFPQVPLTLVKEKETHGGAHDHRIALE